MDENNLSDEVEQKFKSLPEDIRELVYSTDMSSVIQSIGEKYGLHVDQIGQLEDEAANVMVGYSDPSHFVEALSKELHINQSQAATIAEDVNTQLFLKIRESLKQLHSGAKTDSSQTSPPIKTLPEALLPQAEQALTEQTSSVPQKTPIAGPPPSSSSYKVDPYREPIE